MGSRRQDRTRRRYRVRTTRRGQRRVKTRLDDHIHLHYAYEQGNGYHHNEDKEDGNQGRRMRTTGSRHKCVSSPWYVFLFFLFSFYSILTITYSRNSYETGNGHHHHPYPPPTSKTGSRRLKTRLEPRQITSPHFPIPRP